MADIEVLYDAMQQLPLTELQRIQKFIAAQPYKREGRLPTAVEQCQVIAEIQAALERCPPVDMLNPDLLARLQADGLQLD